MKTTTRIVVTAGALSAAFIVYGPTRANSNDDHDFLLKDLASRAQEIRIGYNIAPVPLNIRGKNPLLIGLGSYIVNAQGGCNDCHTRPSYAPGGDPYQGQPTVVNPAQYMSGGRQFGPIQSANLTPDASGSPAGLTFEAFRNELRTGRDADGSGRILQVMPWPIYSNMTDLDLRAMYEYLRAIPSLPDNPEPGP